MVKQQSAVQKAQQKAEEERVKGLPENRAKTWAAGLKGHIDKITSAIRMVTEDTVVTEGVRKDFTDKFEYVVGQMNQLQTSFETVEGGNAESLMRTGLGLIQTRKDLEAAWKKQKSVSK